ncbi:MAG TPA: PQQ-dependent sugar dehydrogenase, partial [Candidatus Saccharimonadales bacterium]|nr:PQQ-dependent sugar dehydrogenase [Candidatus Saccharimonadales bacterium]
TATSAARSTPPASTPSPLSTPDASFIPRLTDTVIQSGMSIPWDLAFAPDGRMFVTERMGNIIVFESGAPNARRLSSTLVPQMRAMGEAGLMGIALDPAFATNGLLYVCASRTDEGEWRNQVLRYKATANALAFDSYVVRAGMAAASIHNGCRVRFGADGKLWVTMGETGSSKLAQDPNSLNGKILRLETDGTIPADNPILPGAAKRTAVYTMGNRNPQGLAVQPGTGAMFEVEHGATSHDEINLLEAGKNYGWPNQEGPGGAAKGFTDPLWSSGSVTLATSGGTFVSGPQWGAWSGSLFVCSLKDQDLRRFRVTGTTVVPQEILFDQKYGRLRSPVLGPDGALYLTTSQGSGDRIIRVTAERP